MDRREMIEDMDMGADVQIMDGCIDDRLKNTDTVERSWTGRHLTDGITQIHMDGSWMGGQMIDDMDADR